MIRFIFAVTALVLVGAVLVFAQGAGRAEIIGRVVSGNGPLHGVLVSAIGAGTRQSVVSDADGRFTLPALLPGNYRISAELAGFQTVTRAVAITATGTLSLDFVLEVGCLSEIHYLDPGWAWALEHADAVVHLRSLTRLAPSAGSWISHVLSQQSMSQQSARRSSWRCDRLCLIAPHSI